MRSVVFLVLLVLAGCFYEGAYYTTEQTVPARQGVTLEDLRALSKAGVSDDVIVARLEADGVAVRPSSEEIAQLKQEGMSDRVMRAWVSAKPTPPATTQRKVVYRSPYYAGVYPYYYGGYPYYGGWYGWGWGYPYYSYRYCH